MKKVVVVFVFVLIGAVLAQVQFPTDCEPCEEEKCPKTDRCVAGMTRDRCGCCMICAKAEFELCDHPHVRPPEGVEYGPCGKNLQCKVRADLLPGDRTEALCYCIDKTILCGSDGQTYDNKCQLEAARITTGKEITIKTETPCRSAPTISLPPEHVKNSTGSNVFMTCEASGVPIPAGEWTWSRVDGKTVYLPSDDLHVSVNVRGGPERYQVTSWLQIMDLMKEHEGDYTCVAQNELGVAEAKARVIVTGDRARNGRDNDVL
jgi:hypothetical protein